MGLSRHRPSGQNGGHCSIRGKNVSREAMYVSGGAEVEIVAIEKGLKGEGGPFLVLVHVVNVNFAGVVPEREDEAVRREPLVGNDAVDADLT